jgi:hypothetical protein
LLLVPPPTFWPVFLGPESRAPCIAEAQAAAYNDAVYLIHYFNSDARRWGPPPNAAPIAPEDVFADHDAARYAAALARVKAMIECALMSFDNERWPSMQDVVASLQQAFPGFDARTYGRVAASAMRDMR